MENASKALIIAGAILLSILIIGIGMTIFRQATGVLDSANMDSQEISAYNGVFEEYEGTRVSGAKVQALVSEIANHNRTEADVNRKIAIVDDAANASNVASDAAAAYTANPSKSTYSTGTTYNVSFTYDNNTGLLIYAIIIPN